MSHRRANPPRQRAAQFFENISRLNLRTVWISKSDTNPEAAGALARNNLGEARVLFWKEQHRISEQVNIGPHTVQNGRPQLGRRIGAMRICSDNLRCVMRARGPQADLWP